jgi:hypothetical protein
VFGREERTNEQAEKDEEKRTKDNSIERGLLPIKLMKKTSRQDHAKYRLGMKLPKCVRILCVVCTYRLK